MKRILAKAPDARSVHERNALFSYWRTAVPEFHEANERIDGLWRAHPVGNHATGAPDRRKHTRETHRLARGDFLSPEGTPWQPGTPAFLHPMSAGAPVASRMEFARVAGVPGVVQPRPVPT